MATMAEHVQINGSRQNDKHFNAWPNAAGFNATGDVKAPLQLPISGKIPSWVAGTLYRTGPGSYKVDRANSKEGVFALDHWFDGFTTVHKFELVAGPDGSCDHAMYSSRSMVDKMIEHARKTGKIDGISFAQKRDPCDSLYKKFKTTFDTTPYTNIGVALRDPCPGELAALKEIHPNIDQRQLMTVTTDNDSVQTIDADTLEPLGITSQNSIHPSLIGKLSAAHAAHDPVTGDVYNYNLHFGPKGATYRIFRASPATGESEVLATINSFDVPGAYIHSISLTENFVIVCVWTAHFRIGGISILLNRNLLDSIAPFDPKAKAVWLVIDRRHGRGLVSKFTSPAFFCFHWINAFETPSQSDPANAVDLNCELFEFASLDILHEFYYDRLVSNSPNARALPDHGAQLARYRLANIPLRALPKTTTGTAEKILTIPAPTAGDLPRINPRFETRPHRYVWGFASRGRSTFADGLVKTDTQTRTCIYWEQDHHTPGEPVFVPSPNATDEDDGVILSVVLDGDCGTSYLLCLDARTMEELGRVDVGRAVGIGLHGRHVPAARVNAS